MRTRPLSFKGRTPAGSAAPVATTASLELWPRMRTTWPTEPAHQAHPRAPASPPPRPAQDDDAWRAACVRRRGIQTRARHAGAEQVGPGRAGGQSKRWAAPRPPRPRVPSTCVPALRPPPFVSRPAPLCLHLAQDDTLQRHCSPADIPLLHVAAAAAHAARAGYPLRPPALAMDQAVGCKNPGSGGPSNNKNRHGFR